MSGHTVGAALDRASPAASDHARSPSITARNSCPARSRTGPSACVQLDFIRPGKPVENAFIESFNGRLRDECLNVHQFTSIEDLKLTIETWRVDYNQRRPHSSLGHLTPDEYAQQRQKSGAEKSHFSAQDLVAFRDVSRLPPTRLSCHVEGYPVAEVLQRGPLHCIAARINGLATRSTHQET